MSVSAEVAELFRIYPRAYERHDGDIIQPSWAGREVPIPPLWVRERVNVPAGCEYATLAKEIEDAYPLSVRIPCVEYIKQWEDVVRPEGAHLVIAGRVDYKKSDWVASAVLNELTLRYGSVSPLSVTWMGAALLQRLMRSDKQHDDTYYTLRHHVERSTVLFVQNVNRMTTVPESRFFLETIYEERSTHRLPTVTTVNTDLKDDEDWDRMRKVLGDYIVDTLMYRLHPEFLAHF